MSFSSKVKEEISTQFGNARHCQIAELAGILNICGEIPQNIPFFCVKMQTEHPATAKKYFTLLKNTFNIKCIISVKSGMKKRRVYTVTTLEPNQAEKLLRATGLLAENNGERSLCRRIYSPVVSSTCCRRAFLRGTFLECGSVNDPEKNYHLEFVHTDQKFAEELRKLLQNMHLDAKLVKRKDQFVVYLKEGNHIVDLLNIMGAYVALMELENIRIVKEMRNDINRRCNFETANLKKVVDASVKQIEDITLIQNTIGLDQLPPPLEEVALARLQYPDMNLKELGTMLSSPLGKSGVNHRLKKICQIADTIREDKGELQ